MNGPEHYLEAERLIDLAHQPGLPGGSVRAEAIAQAQVHATLALAAATASAAAELPADGETARQWRQLVSVKRTPIEVPA